jgi:hypothetical protein
MYATPAVLWFGAPSPSWVLDDSDMTFYKGLVLVFALVMGVCNALCFCTGPTRTEQREQREQRLFMYWRNRYQNVLGTPSYAAALRFATGAPTVS